MPKVGSEREMEILLQPSLLHKTNLKQGSTANGGKKRNEAGHDKNGMKTFAPDRKGPPPRPRAKKKGADLADAFKLLPNTAGGESNLKAIQLLSESKRAAYQQPRLDNRSRDVSANGKNSSNIGAGIKTANTKPLPEVTDFDKYSDEILPDESIFASTHVSFNSAELNRMFEENVDEAIYYLKQKERQEPAEEWEMTFDTPPRCSAMKWAIKTVFKPFVFVWNKFA